jgi:hypothetical protein
MFYGVAILGMVLGGLLLLVIYSLLAMVQKCDEFYDQLDMGAPGSHGSGHSRAGVVRLHKALFTA